MVITAATDLTQFAGRRVRINRGRTAVIATIRHGNTSPFKALHGGFGGMCDEEPYGTEPGGPSAYWRRYGTDLTIV
jgi:hypothetical protein